MFAVVFLAENGCEFTFSHRQWVLSLVIVVASTMPFSPGRAAVCRRGWFIVVAGLWAGARVQILGSGVAARSWRIKISEVGGVTVGGPVLGP
jgi:hypothetical protein